VAARARFLLDGERRKHDASEDWMTQTGKTERKSSLRALLHAQFALFFGGNLLSNCGTWFQNIALSLLVYRLTRSALWVGVANFAQFAGVVLLAPWAGSAADRVDRRRLILWTQIAAAGVSGVLAVAVAARYTALPIVLGLALLLGFTTAFATPALQAIIPNLVPREDLGAAVAMNSVTFNLARAIGPVAGALVVARLGIASAIAINALSYLVFAAALLFVHPRESEERAAQRARLRDSIRMVAHDRRLALLLTVVAAVSLALDPVSTLSPIYASRIFHRPDTFAGYLIGSFGVGAVIASVIPLGESRAPERRIAAMLALFGGGMVAFALVPSLAATFVALAAAGFGYLMGQTSATTLLQLGVSNQERGRVMALWSIAFLGTRPVASLVDGGLATLIGPRGATIAMTVPVFVTAAVLLRGLGQPAHAKPDAKAAA
jgi:MFS family permease